MPRPRLPARDRRREQLQVYVSISERRAISQLAADRGVTVSDAIRAALLKEVGLEVRA